MKFLICGLGSTGKRVAENLEELGYECEDIGFFRTHRGAVSFSGKFLISHNKRHPIFTNIHKALAKKPKAVFVTNPTSLHIETAITVANAGCHLFITKPLSHSLKGIKRLQRKAKENNLIVYISYQLRFHPLLGQVKKWLDEKRIGDVISVSAELSERVTDFHPWEDYRISYAGRKDLGGGVVLSFSHEIDYLYWLFGKPLWVFAAGGKLSTLDIDTEDTSVSIIQFKDVLASLHLDYLKRPAKRFLEITGSDGRIYWDYFAKKVQLIPLESRPITVTEPHSYNRNKMHVDELKHFLDCVRGKSQPLIELTDGIEVLKICLEIKKSQEKHKIVYL